MYCQSTGNAQPKYFSGVFVMTSGMEGVDNAFTQELIAKYGFKGTSSCSVAYAQTPIAKVKEDVERQIAQLKAGGTNVVATSWVYVPAAVKLPRFCFAYVTVTGVTTAYTTDILQVPGSTTTDDLKKSWSAYFSKQHANASPQCLLLPPGEMEQKNYASQLDQWKAKNYKIERVAWSYAGATAATSAASPAPNPALSGAAAATAGNGERSYFCYGNSADRKKQYITPLTPVPASVPEASAPEYVASTVRLAWTAYVHGELGQGAAAYAACGGGAQTAQVEASRIQMLRTGSGSAVMTEVAWRYTGTASSGSAAPATPAATPSAAPAAPAPGGAASTGASAAGAAA
ncbi:MAG TPA: hypothetical protein VFJ95_18215, partial [Gammaproteobacteria bacterium]|nr:hypothetical protein [Gammaproteobacteria bacterium]